MNVFKIALYGDSLACPRQGVVASHERYIALVDTFLRNAFSGYIELRDKAMAGATLPELFGAYHKDNTYYTLPGEILIIHSGIVDCAPRPISDKLRARISMMPAFIRNLIVNYIHKNRRRLILSGKKYVRTEKEVFQSTINDMMLHGIENYKRLMVVNIAPALPEFDKRSPGLADSIKLYNSLIADSIKKINSTKIELIDIHTIISEKKNILDFVVKEDGHHIHPITHKLIADKIIEKCKELL